MYAEGTIQTGKVWFATKVQLSADGSSIVRSVKVPLSTVWW
jgi:hypothetical protein